LCKQEQSFNAEDKESSNAKNCFILKKKFIMAFLCRENYKSKICHFCRQHNNVRQGKDASFSRWLSLKQKKRSSEILSQKEICKKPFITP